MNKIMLSIFRLSHVMTFLVIALFYIDQSFAVECGVINFATPDEVQLQEEANKLAELPRKKRELKIRYEKEYAQRQSEATQREIKRERDLKKHYKSDPVGPDIMTGRPAGNISLPPNFSFDSMETITIQDGDKNVEIKIARGADHELARKSYFSGKKLEQLPENPVISAIDSGDLRALKELIAQGVDIRTVKDKYSQKGLVARAINKWYYGTAAVLRQKNELQARLNHRDKVASTYVNIVKALVSAGANPSETYQGSTPLKIISSNLRRQPNPPGALELTRYLLEHGASQVLPATGFDSVLDLAAAQDNQELLDVFLRYGNPDQKQKNSALVTAVQSNNWKLSTHLLEAGADPNVSPSDYGKCCTATLLDRILVWSPLPRDFLTSMIRHKLNPNQRLTLGLTPTPLMRVLHDTELMKAFLDTGADPNAQDKDGNTALHLATRVITFRSNENLNLEADLLGVAYFQVTDTETRARTIELLLRYGAKPDAINHAGMTPLMLTMVDDAKIINLLLNAGAKTININAGTPKILRQYNISIGPVSWALLQGNETLATQWIQKFGTVQDSDCGAVYYAARGGSATTLNALLDANAPRTVSENSGETPLIGAAMAGHVSTVKLLLDRGAADINEGTRVPDIKSKQMGVASLDYAAAHNSLGGVTPLMAAIKAEKTEVVKLLIDRGADFSRRDKLGQTALDYAKGAQNSEILTLMKSAGVASKKISQEEIKEQQDFADSIAIKIQKSLGSGIKDFSLSPGADSNPVLPGDDSSVEMVECEKRSIFTIYDSASEQGRIAVSVCNKNAQRARDLAIHASQTTSTALKDIGIPELSEAQFRKAGWYAVHKTLSDGEDFYYFPMIFVGHGIFNTQTTVLYNEKSADAVVIQFSAYPMCESDAYKNAPACKNIDETLESLAVAVKH